MKRWVIDFDHQEIRDGRADENHWDHLLDRYLEKVREWLYEPANIADTMALIESTLIAKHHDYGEENLHIFGELGLLVRTSDKVARLKNLLDKAAEVGDETRADTWQDLAGYAIQALILLKMGTQGSRVGFYEIRKNRLIRGFCPDCGKGVLLRAGWFIGELICSERCGFYSDEQHLVHGAAPEEIRMAIEYLAEQDAMGKQQ